ncbi:unnamed protein product, partial [marine sediment metagenome]
MRIIMEHTPGPWVVDALNRILAGGLKIAKIPVSNLIHLAERKANAKLITAAPDLLYHLCALLEILPECECDNTHKQNDTKCRMCFAKEAI